MSKIYEALLRAEQERGTVAPPGAANSDEAQTGSEESTRLSAESPVVRETSMPFASEALATPQADLSFQTQAPLAAGTPQAPAAPGSFMAQGKTEVWKPDYTKLPALTSRGAQVEQFRGLRSKLFEFRSLNRLKTVLVSSALPSEGKSFIAANLALTLARHKAARVLLIDGDLRRHSQQKLLGAVNEPGLAEFLAGKVDLQQIIYRGMPESKDAPLPVGLASLCFIPAGNAGDKAADLAGSPRFSELLAAVGPHYDWVIVDSSPVNLVSDGVIFARACDGVLFVARGGVTKLVVAQRALAELKAAKVLGVVLNAVDRTAAAKGYYGYYGYESPTS